VFHISIWWGLELCLGGAKPTKAPRGDGTAYKPNKTFRKRWRIKRTKHPKDRNSAGTDEKLRIRRIHEL